MAEAVREIRSVSGRLDYVSGFGVEVAEPRAGLHDRLGGQIGAQNRLVYGAVAVGDTPVIIGARHVGTIIVPDAADVEEHAVALFEHGPVG